MLLKSLRNLGQGRGGWLVNILWGLSISDAIFGVTLLLFKYKGLFTLGRKRKRIRNVNLKWFKTVRAFTLAQKQYYKRKFTFTAAVFD